MMFRENDISTWNEADYQRLVAELDTIFPADAPGNPNAERCLALCDLVWQYEQVHFPIEAAPPVVAIEQGREKRVPLVKL